MGDHVCGSGEPTPPPDSYGSFDRMPYKQNPTNGPGTLKPGRAMPPRVDTSAANRPFFRQDQLTPVSMSPSRSGSPLSPNDRSRSPFGRPIRSKTAPVNQPPSPELLSSNLDCAFPPFPSTNPAPTKPPIQREGGYGGFAIKPAKMDPMYAPVSPRTATSGGLLQRMNTIAPGPFDVNGRRDGDIGTVERVHQRQKSLKDVTMSTRTAEVNSHIVRPSTASGHSRTSTNSSSGSRSGIPRIPGKNGYGGFGPPTSNADGVRQPLRPEDRAHTFPLQSGSQESYRRPSEPDTRFRRPSNESGPRPPAADGRTGGSPLRQRRPSNSGPDLSRPLPPRGGSLMRPRTDTRAGDAPPVPSHVNLAAEFGIGNPYHTPSESQSSSASGYSQESKASSRSSPPHSAGPARPPWKPSNITNLDNLMSEVQSSMAELQPRPGFSSSPPKERFARGMAPPRGLDPSLLSPESPMDPAIQGGRISPIPTRDPTRNQPRSSPPKDIPARRPTTSKGNCKGCGEAIKGKSVSSADGRLTGRYHKQCFVCATCSEPFQTSTFYVIDDSPYCERHYHKLNGSVCDTCDKGIEGQYLESERKQKFHPGCLTCADCKRNLRNDYFEMNGKVYCERDAFRRAQQGRFLGPGGGTNRMERRTTRLMMM